MDQQESRNQSQEYHEQQHSNPNQNQQHKSQQEYKQPIQNQYNQNPKYLPEQKKQQFIVTQSLEIDQQSDTGIKIAIAGNQVKGSGLFKFTVYLIKGYDKQGVIEVYRRYNQFFTLRKVMLVRWPGCFIPAVPDKNLTVNQIYQGKNDAQVVKNRQRFLDDFLKKMSQLPHIFYGQEFQSFIRSKQTDLSPIFQKWPRQPFEQIIKKYKQAFGELSGVKIINQKQINSQTSIKISQFTTFLKKNQALLPSYKQMARNLAESRQTLDNKLSTVFSKILLDYQKTCISQFVEGNQALLLYANPKLENLQKHGQQVQHITKKNPYWLIYDLIKLEQRDGEAFLDAIRQKDNLQLRRQQVQVKIKQNQNQIQQLALGKSTFRSMTSRGSKQQLKYKVQSQTEQLIKQKENLIVLCDIIGALLAYITIDKYKVTKRRFYYNVMKRIGGYECYFISKIFSVWEDLNQSTSKLA